MVLLVNPAFMKVQGIAFLLFTACRPLSLTSLKYDFAILLLFYILCWVV